MELLVLLTCLTLNLLQKSAFENNHQFTGSKLNTAQYYEKQHVGTPTSTEYDDKCRFLYFDGVSCRFSQRPTPSKVRVFLFDSNCESQPLDLNQVRWWKFIRGLPCPAVSVLTVCGRGGSELASSGFEIVLSGTHNARCQEHNGKTYAVNPIRRSFFFYLLYSFLPPCFSSKDRMNGSVRNLGVSAQRDMTVLAEN
ncbi:hypothetical protein CDAR_5841 [Caerostris darwini]|uniref:Uncharacterized protein n=1 Tax=Caerostris darwini TaxID=1538125 RepID=A0AAV4RIS2_9ARAC|nr:hypothetical protein CDAR_5841 [Caerostris darwini]